MREACRRLRKQNVESVAISLLFSFVNPAHEQRVAQIVAEEMPGVHISSSHQVLPRSPEYDRTSTTVVNAYVGPLIRGYLQGLENRLREAGYQGALLVMLSHGGVAPVAEAVRIAAGTVLSGPAGGLAGARRVADMLGLGHVGNRAAI